MAAAEIVAVVPERVLVVFTPSGRRGYFPPGTPVLEAARDLGVDLESLCGGNGQCGRCQFEPGEGEYAKHGISVGPDHLSPVTEVELLGYRSGVLSEGRRLGCAAKLLNDMVVDVPAGSQTHQQVIRKEAEALDIDLQPAVRLYTVEVPPPLLDVPSSDLQRLQQQLSEQYLLPTLASDLGVLQQLQKSLRKGEWSVTVAVHNGRTLAAVWPGIKERVYGLAVDVGSTTLALHLCDLTDGQVIASSGVMNPQIRYGEDLMSRISYVMLNSGGDAEMTAAVRQALNESAMKLAESAAIDVTDILDMTLVGNPVMHHLLLGIDPTELGGAPFALATDSATSLLARDLEIELNPGAQAYLLPCIAGHVGADAAAVILAEKPYLSDEMELLVDVGTNAEIILGNRHRLLAASSPTGPAFEGAQISGGQRASAGAIERVRIDPHTLEPRFKVIGCDLWSDDQGFEAALSGITISGICGSGIIEVVGEMLLAGVIDRDGVVDGAMGERSCRVVKQERTFSYLLYDGEITLTITQNDIRAIQLAKAALYAGIRLLMDRMDIQTVDSISLAGAFGSHIDPRYAMLLGMIPDCDPEKVKSAGNAAGGGARMALLDIRERRVIETILERVEKIETATEPAFQQHFIDAMAIPHRTAPYEKLSSLMTIPKRKERGAAVTRRGRRRSSRTAC